MRVYVIGRDYQATEIDVADAAGRFMAWLVDSANPALTEVIQAWLWQPADAGGLGALAESMGDVALLRAELVAAWRDAGSGSGSGRHERGRP